MMMNSIDWLGSACDPAVILDIGYKTLPHEFFIGQVSEELGNSLLECLLSLFPPSLCVSGLMTPPCRATLLDQNDYSLVFLSRIQFSLLV